MELLKEHILKLENDLLKSDTRKSAEKISEILSNNFVEFCSSGFEYHYKYGDIYQEKDDNTELNWEIVNFEIERLSDDCVLAMYKVIKHNELNENKKYTLRSSIWKCNDKKWKMIFHQGTLTSKF